VHGVEDDPGDHRTFDLFDHAPGVVSVADGERSVHENDGWVSHDQDPPLWSIRHGDRTCGGIWVASVKRRDDMTSRIRALAEG
jgi:hypothetical protein